MEKKELEKIVRKAMNGNDKYFKQLVESKSQSILFSSYNILGDMEAAEMAAVEVITGMYKNLKDLEDPALFNPWIHKMIFKACDSITAKRAC